MIKKNHNNYSKQFMQKILLFIDTIFINAANSNAQDANKFLIEGIMNTRDALLTEIIKDNQIDSFNQLIQEEQSKNIQKKTKEKKESKDLNPDQVSENDQNQ